MSCRGSVVFWPRGLRCHQWQRGCSAAHNVHIHQPWSPGCCSAQISFWTLITLASVEPGRRKSRKRCADTCFLITALQMCLFTPGKTIPATLKLRNKLTLAAFEEKIRVFSLQLLFVKILQKMTADWTLRGKFKWLWKKWGLFMNYKVKKHH